MDFQWQDYDPHTMGYVEDWLDESAVRSTGLEDGFRDFYEYWAQEEGYQAGANFWAKVVFDHHVPFGVIACSMHEGKMTIMEVFLAPEKRRKGMGAALLKELLNGDTVLGFQIEKAEAVIFPGNKASQRAFEKAGFYHHHTYEDGTARIYVYEI